VIGLPSRTTLALSLIVLAACSRASVGREPTEAQALAPSISVVTVPARSDAGSAPAAPPAPGPGVVKVKGYPHPLRNGMNDPARRFGFSKDGAEFGYCAELGGRDPQVTRCELVRRDGKKTTMTSETGGAFDPAKKRAIDSWLDENSIPEIAPLPGDPTNAVPPPLTGTWPFPDVTLEVLRVEPTLTKSGEIGSPAVVRVGGAVGSEPAVYPITLSHVPIPEAPPHFAVMNGMAISPDGTEIGMVAHFFACEYCDTFKVARTTLRSLASRVYNDTGFRHHKRGAFAESARLFARAEQADPGSKLPPYNLACAYARLGDPRVKETLERAVTRDPKAKERARKDVDFASVRSSPWFRTLTE
jgi:hypothetical protein